VFYFAWLIRLFPCYENLKERDHFGGRPNHHIRIQIPKTIRNPIIPAQNAIIGPAMGNTINVIIVGMMKIAKARMHGTICLRRLSCTVEVCLVISLYVAIIDY
jgi:hypothetical protein